MTRVPWKVKLLSCTPTSRRGRVAFAAGCLALGTSAWAQDAAPVPKAPSAADNQSRTSLHQEMVFKLGPQRLYTLLLNSQDFTAFSGSPATIDPKAGGAFSLFGGKIVGLNVELIPNQLIVQAWRAADWPAGVYSLVRIQLKPQGTDTLLILDHTGFGTGGYSHLSTGWMEYYWQPLSKYLAAGAK
jgi:activator of HSP90 ATPase